MPLEVHFEVSPTHARARVQGEGSLVEFLDILRRVAAMSSHAHPLLVLDLSQLRGLERSTEQMTAGMQAAHQLGHVHRVAVIEPRSRVTLNGEKVARRLGLDLRVFATEQEPQAMAWLVADTHAAGSPCS